jgi:hypothetical protein
LTATQSLEKDKPENKDETSNPLHILKIRLGMVLSKSVIAFL